MKCSMNESCKRLSNDVLPNTKTTVNNDFNEINESIENIEIDLKGLEIPNDYIGNKLNTKLEELYESLDLNINDNTNVINDFNNYIDNEIKVHNNHYETWKKKEEEKNKEDEE